MHNKYYDIVRVNINDKTDATLLNLEIDLLKHYNSFTNKLMIRSYIDTPGFDGYIFSSKINMRLD